MRVGLRAHTLLHACPASALARKTWMDGWVTPPRLVCVPLVCTASCVQLLKVLSFKNYTQHGALFFLVNLMLSEGKILPSDYPGADSVQYDKDGGFCAGGGGHTGRPRQSLLLRVLLVLQQFVVPISATRALVCTAQSSRCWLLMQSSFHTLHCDALRVSSLPVPRVPQA